MCLTSSLVTLFIFCFILDSKTGTGLQTFFEEHKIISVKDLASTFEYHIVPFKEVRKTYRNITTFQYAKYVSLYENQTHTIMHYSTELSKSFDLLLICDPLEKFKPGILNCGSTCSFDILTDAVCPYIYRKGDEL